MLYMPSVQTITEGMTVESGYLRIIASDVDARPMSFVSEGVRQGFEPALTRILCDLLGLSPVWFDVPFKDFYSTLSTGEFDVVWFNQVITQERRAWADFTRPYGRFDTGVLVLENSAIHEKSDLAGRRVGVLAASVSSQLLDLFPADVEPVYFDGDWEIGQEIFQALQAGRIDAIIEDALILRVKEAQDPTVRVAFEVPTQHPFGIAVLPGNRELLEALNQGLNSLITDGTLNRLWGQWIPYKPYPF